VTSSGVLAKREADFGKGSWDLGHWGCNKRITSDCGLADQAPDLRGGGTMDFENRKSAIWREEHLMG